MDLKITKDDGQTYTLGQEGITVHDVVVKGIELDTMTEQIAGLHGDFNIGATYKSREIVVPFSFKGNDLSEYPLFRDLLFQLATDIKPFYIQEMRRPRQSQYLFKDTTYKESAISLDQYGRETVFDDYQGDNEISTGVRYKVRLTGAVEIEQKKHTSEGRGELTFETVGLPFGESVGTSLDLQANGLNYSDDNLFTYGMGAAHSDVNYTYTFSTATATSFDVYNIGDVPIDQFNQHAVLKITLGQDLTTPINFGFNNTSMRIDGSDTTLKAGDVITITNGGYFRNDLNISGATNYEMLDIPVGKSKLMFDKAFKATVELEMRFYYL